MRVKELYESKRTAKKLPGYVPLATYPDYSEIITINADAPSNIKGISNISLYVFSEKALAKEYIELVFSYIGEEHKNPKKGLKFWPEFRNLIKKAINYDIVNNIAPTRKSLLTALQDMDTIYENRQKMQRGRAAYRNPKVARIKK